MLHHVILATIPERRKSLLQVIACLKDQLRPADKVWVCLDKVQDDLPRARRDANMIASMLPACEAFIAEKPGRGCFERWRALDAVGANDLVTVIDDDWFLETGFLDRCWWESRSYGVIAWMGWVAPYLSVGAMSRMDCPVPLAYACGGTITGRADLLRSGWHYVPGELVKRPFGDDIALSVGLHRAHIKRVRPKGWSHMIELPAGHGPEAMVTKHKSEMLEALQEMFTKYEVHAL